MLWFGMLMKGPPEWRPDPTPRRKLDADAYLFAFSIVLFMGAVLIVTYALFTQ